MGDCSDKNPIPTGLLRLATSLCEGALGAGAPTRRPISVNTVADVQDGAERPQGETARTSAGWSLAVVATASAAPGLEKQRSAYEGQPAASGADRLLPLHLRTSARQPASVAGPQGS